MTILIEINNGQPIHLMWYLFILIFRILSLGNIIKLLTTGPRLDKLWNVSWFLSHVEKVNANHRSRCGKVCTIIRPWGYKTWVQAQTQNKAQWLAACGHVSANSQSLRFILSLKMNSSFITSRPGDHCGGSVFCACFVMQYFMAFLVSQSSW